MIWIRLLIWSRYALNAALWILLALMVLAMASCDSRSGVSRERELIAAEALAGIQESAKALQDPSLPDESRQAIPRAQERWARTALRALHAEVDDGSR